MKKYGLPLVLLMMAAFWACSDEVVSQKLSMERLATLNLSEILTTYRIATKTTRKRCFGCPLKAYSGCAVTRSGLP